MPIKEVISRICPRGEEKVSNYMRILY